MKYLTKLFTFAGFLEAEGEHLIHEAHGLFDGIVAKLEKGAQQCLHKMQRNADVISEKLRENEALHRAVDRASATAANLRQLVSTPTPPAAPEAAHS